MIFTRESTHGCFQRRMRQFLSGVLYILVFSFVFCEGHFHLYAFLMLENIPVVLRKYGDGDGQSMLQTC